MTFDVDWPEIERMIAKITASGALGKSGAKGGRAPKLLSYILQEEDAGRGDRLKAYTIALDVFGRPASFDPAQDNIVRVEFGRLRKALAAYYEADGRTDAYQIDIPKGGYRPTIERSKTVGQSQTPNLAQPETFSSGGIALSVLPFRSAIDDPTITAMALGLSHELFAELSHNTALAMIQTGGHVPNDQNTDIGKLAADLGAKYLIKGVMVPLADELRVTIELYSGLSGGVIWARTYQTMREMTGAGQVELIGKIATDLRPMFYNAEKLELEGRPEEDLTADQLFLLSTWVSGAAFSTLAWESRRVKLAQRALILRPDFGKAHSVLADKMIYLAAIDPPSDTPENMKAGIYHARRARELSPNEPDVFMNITMHHWHLGELDQALTACQRLSDLEPSNGIARLMSFVIPYTTKEPPQDVVDRVLEFDRSLAPDNPIRWFSLSWASRLLLNRLDYKVALDLETRGRQIFQTPDSLLRLAVLNFKCGHTDTAFEIINEQFQNWPNMNPSHLTEVSLRRRRSAHEGDDPVLSAYREFVTAYDDYREKKIVPFSPRP